VKEIGGISFSQVFYLGQKRLGSIGGGGIERKSLESHPLLSRKGWGRGEKSRRNHIFDTLTMRMLGIKGLHGEKRTKKRRIRDNIEYA